MTIKTASQLWASANAVYRGNGIAVTSRRILFFIKALASYRYIKPLIEAPRTSALARFVQHRPEVIGAVIWPYQCAGWNAATRLTRIHEHFLIVEKIGSWVDFPIDGKRLLLDLAKIYEGLSVAVDQPVWFMREGQLAINLFVEDTRMYTLAFSFFYHDDKVAAFVGAIQGRDIEGALAEYRELTKACHGMRPRDFLIEIFRMFCAELGVTTIFAVSDEFRHHRDRYFGEAPAKKFTTDYNDVWTDRGAKRVDPMSFQLSVNSAEREIDTIPAKKRGMYRRRFEMLRLVREQLHERYCKFRSNPRI